MLTLSILRHAKSSWSEPSHADFDRPLSTRGESAAPLMGKYMRTRNLAPDLVLCSTARRTRQTLELALPELAAEPKVKLEESLYLAAPAALLKRVRRVPKTSAHLLLVGHNPGLQELALELIGEGEPSDLDRLRAKLPTAGLVVITFQVEAWAKIGARSGRLTLFASPRMLS